MIRKIRNFFSCKSMVNQDMIVGVMPSSRILYKNTFHMAWPSIVEAVLIGLIGAIDTMMVGGLGDKAIASVGITTQPRFLFLALIISLNIGVTTVVARRKGQDDKHGANNCLKQACIISAIISLLETSAALFFAEPILRFAGASDDIIVDAISYFRIMISGLFFTSISLTINAAQRGAGKTKISMITNISANIVNIIFNYLLITGKFGFPKMGVSGAALATVFGYLVAFVMSLTSVCKKEQFLSFIGKTGWKFDTNTIKGITNVGASALVEQLCMRFGFFSYVKIVAGLGTIAFATHQICGNVVTLSFCFGDGLAIAASALVGQSLGAKRPDLAAIYAKTSQRIALCISLCLMVFFIIGREFVMELFIDDAQIISMGAQIMLIISVITLPQTSQIIISGCLRGAGDTKYVAGVSLISTAIARPVITWLLCNSFGLGLIGAWLSMLIDQAFRLVVNFARFRKGKWTKIDV